MKPIRGALRIASICALAPWALCHGPALALADMYTCGSFNHPWPVQVFYMQFINDSQTPLTVDFNDAFQCRWDPQDMAGGKYVLPPGSRSGWFRSVSYDGFSYQSMKLYTRQAQDDDTRLIIGRNRFTGISLCTAANDRTELGTSFGMDYDVTELETPGHGSCIVNPVQVDGQGRNFARSMSAAYSTPGDRPLYVSIRYQRIRDDHPPYAVYHEEHWVPDQPFAGNGQLWSYPAGW